MTNAQIIAMYQANLPISHVTALRAVYSAGWYSGASQTMTAASADKSFGDSNPANMLKLTNTHVHLSGG
jgi:hypothetical protein